MPVRRKKEIAIRKKKEFTFRGKTLEELKSMSLNELIKLLPARARRSLKRGLNHDQKVFFDKVKKGEKQIIKTHRRDLVILPELVGKKVGIHMGNSFKEVEIKEEMIGHYLGEFALTRKFPKHTGPGVGATRSSKFMPLK